MNNRNEYIRLWLSYETYFQEYTDAEVGRLVRAMFRYASDGEGVDFPGPERYMWPVLKREIDETHVAIEAKHQRQLENGKKGGRPPKDKSSSESPVVKGNEDENLEVIEKPNGFEKNPKNPLVSEKPNGFEKTQGKGEGKGKGQGQGEGNITPLPPSRGGSVSGRDADFEEFWAVYPKKVGKQDARRVFKKVKADVHVLIDAVNAQKKSQQWQRDGGQYIPNPSTWLNQGRWEDELPEFTPVSNGPCVSGVAAEDIDRLFSISGGDPF